MGQNSDEIDYDIVGGELEQMHFFTLFPKQNNVCISALFNVRLAVRSFWIRIWDTNACLTAVDSEYKHKVKSETASLLLFTSF